MHDVSKLLSCDNGLNSHQQSTMPSNYHIGNHNNRDYRNGSFYDSQQSYYCIDDADESLHRQHHSTDRHSTITIASTATASTTATSSSDASKSERQMSINHYHQQNGFRAQSNNQPVNNNECELMMAGDSHASMHQRNVNAKQAINQYGKIINFNKLQTGGKDHRNGTRLGPIPMLPSPPSTPPPPLNAKIKDYHDSSNKFYQEFQSTLHLSNQQQNHFNGNINNNNNNTCNNSSNNNNNEVNYEAMLFC